MNIVLKHPNGDRKSVPVEQVAATYVAIRWEGAGIYDLNLKDNILTPRGPIQTKGKAKWSKKDKPQWVAEDIFAVRRMVTEHLNPGKKTEMAKAIEAHNASMPRGEVTKLKAATEYGIFGGTTTVNNDGYMREYDVRSAYPTQPEKLGSILDRVIRPRVKS